MPCCFRFPPFRHISPTSGLPESLMVKSVNLLPLVVPLKIKYDIVFVYLFVNLSCEITTEFWPLYCSLVSDFINVFAEMLQNLNPSSGAHWS